MHTQFSARSSPSRTVLRYLKARPFIVGVMLFTFSIGASAGMFGFFKKKHEIVLSPEVHGRLTNDHVPLGNTTIYRELFYEKRFVERTTTKIDGTFYFPEKIIRSNAPDKLFGETHVTQLIAAEYNGEMYILWSTSTTNINGPKTLQEKLSRLNCDLKSPEELVHFENQETPDFTHNVTTICRW